jgi:hypothetical protein
MARNALNECGDWGIHQNERGRVFIFLNLRFSAGNVRDGRSRHASV